ncbi:unnamed protein product, partial [Meganyctiphanes norvegica]
MSDLFVKKEFGTTFVENANELNEIEVRYDSKISITPDERYCPEDFCQNPAYGNIEIKVKEEIIVSEEPKKFQAVETELKEEKEINEEQIYFTRESSLLKPGPTHTGYQYNKCEGACIHTQNTIEHNITNTDERPCQCGKAFSLKSVFNEQLRPQFAEKPYKCSQSNTIFSHKLNIINHQRTNTGEKSYECSQCDKAFSEKSNLIKHQRTHTGEKPYHCSLCDKAFSDKSN